ncbi:CHAT domain-containing protein [Parasphingorhabdus sp. DH2-15]|uniref:CHAT domain-containing protein n=1 Tax=Parasphingorhabdus sp. DH2-15 TaxID=3444112 RepID=UPI003F6830F5
MRHRNAFHHIGFVRLAIYALLSFISGAISISSVLAEPTPTSSCVRDVAALDPAFHAAQMVLASRSSVALDRTLIMPDAEREKLRALLAERDALRSDRSFENAGEASQALFDNDERVIALERQINQIVPDLLEALSPRTLSIREIQSQLTSAQLLLVFLEADQRSFGWAITRDCVSWQVLEAFGRAQSGPLVTQLRQALDPGAAQARGRSIPIGDQPTVNLNAALEWTYTHIMAPFEHVMKGKSEILVHGEGNFLAVPFAALRREGVAGYLIDDYSFAWLPSLKTLSISGSKPIPVESQTAKILAVGAPSAFPETEAEALLPLPGAKEELRALSSQLGDRAVILSGGQANEGLFRETLSAVQPSVLLFATHALVGRREHGERTGLALAPTQSSMGTPSERDGLLTPTEIAGLPLEGMLAILAGCETWASEGGGSGEALTALSLAFFQAGARDLVVTHWRIADGSAARWSQAMLAELVKRPDKVAAAVRAGQLALRKYAGGRYDDPRHWAAYIPVISTAN